MVGRTNAGAGGDTSLSFVKEKTSGSITYNLPAGWKTFAYNFTGLDANKKYFAHISTGDVGEITQQEVSLTDALAGNAIKLEQSNNSVVACEFIPKQSTQTITVRIYTTAGGSGWTRVAVIDLYKYV